MRHKVIERMFRDQYCMRDCDRVDVTFIIDIDGVSEFLIEDYVEQNNHTTLRKTILKIGVVKQEVITLD